MTYDDIGIKGVNPYSQGEQRVKCPKCPPHKHANDNSKDLSVNVTLGIYFCHRCAWTGTTKAKTEIIKQYEPIQITDISEETKEVLKMYKYFESRGISKKVVQRNKITIKLNHFFNEKKLNAICFNYFLGDDCLNVKYRSGLKDFSQYKGGAKIFYKLNDIAFTNEVIITEGEFDALSFEEVGLQNAVSVPEGGINPNTKNINSKLDFIDNSIDFIENKTKFYLALDTDNAGIGMRDELARRFGKSKCYIITFPNDCKDANDTLVKYGKDTLLECYYNAKPYPVDGVLYANDFTNDILSIYEKGYGSKDNTGWNEFDKHITRPKGQLIIVTGIPSHGKTTFTMDWITRLNITQGLRFAIFSPEHSISGLTIKLARQIIGKNVNNDYADRMSKLELEEAIKYINDNFYFIKPKDTTNKLNDILEALEYLVLSKGIHGVILDSWAKITHSISEKQSETQYTASILNSLSEITKRYDLRTILIAHPYKMQTDSGKTLTPSRPDLYSISGSAHFNNLADIGICVFRKFSDDKNVSTTEIDVLKCREDYMGKIGTVRFQCFSASGQRFFENHSDLNFNSRIVVDDYPPSWDLV